MRILALFFCVFFAELLKKYSGSSSSSSSYRYSQPMPPASAEAPTRAHARELPPRTAAATVRDSPLLRPCRKEVDCGPRRPSRRALRRRAPRSSRRRCATNADGSRADVVGRATCLRRGAHDAGDPLHQSPSRPPRPCAQRPRASCCLQPLGTAHPRLQPSGTARSRCPRWQLWGSRRPRPLPRPRQASRQQRKTSRRLQPLGTAQRRLPPNGTARPVARLHHVTASSEATSEVARALW